MTSLRAGLVVLAFASSLYGQATYYVAPSGSDTNSGTSRTRAWRTLNRANDLHNGDTLLLAGGSTFSGSLHIRASNITIGSYGKGRATIDSGDESAIDANGVGGLRISNLNLRSTSLARKVLDRTAIEIINRGPKLNAIRIDHVEMSGFSFAGIVLRANDRITGFDGITIDSVSIRDVGYVGIAFYAIESGAFRNFSVRHSEISNVTGYFNAYGIVVQGTGSGIIGQGLVTGTISNNHIYDNGLTFGGGGFAIALERPLDVTIEENELRDMHWSVGGGIDIDGGVSIRIRYNYTHDNYGPGIRLCACASGVHEVVVHHNISENDGAPASVELAGTFPSDSIAVFHNTIFKRDGTALASGPSFSALFANNIFLTEGGTAVDASTGSTFLANDYFDFSGILRLMWNGATFGSLPSWGQDPLGIETNPQLIRPGVGGAMFPAALSDLDAYRLTPNSPVIDEAEDLRPRGFDIGLRDYFGGVEQTIHGSDIGAYEFRTEPYAPSIEPIASRSVEVGDAIEVDVWLHDPDGTNSVTLALAGAPPFATIKRVSGSHAIITLAPVVPGQTTIRVRATDEFGLTDEKTFNVNVTGGVRTRAIRRR